MRRTIRKEMEGSAFHMLVEYEDGMLLEFSGNVGSEDNRVDTRTASEEEAKLLSECYAGPNDERLPDEVKALPIGRREDFVDAFNNNFYWYYKPDDPDYDENVSKEENQVRYAFKMANDKISKEKESDISEAYSGPNVQRIQETFSGGVPFESFKESAGGLSNEITVIQHGWSLNGNHYGSDALKGIADGCNEMVVGYFNHGPTFSRDPRDWAIVTESGRLDGNQVKSQIHVFKHPDGEFLKERIEYAKRKKANHLFGVSIDAFAEVHEGEIGGEDGVIVDRILRLNSVDIVMVPAAKGNFLTTESVKDKLVEHQAEENTMEVIDVKTLKEGHPDTAKLLIEEGRAEGNAVLEGQIADLHKDVTEGQTKVEALETDLAKAQAKLDEYVEAEKHGKFVSDVSDLIKEGLDQGKRSEKFEKILVKLGESNLDTIKEMIADRQESVITPVITGEGKETDVVEAVNDDKNKQVEESLSDEEARLKDFKSNLGK